MAERGSAAGPERATGSRAFALLSWGLSFHILAIVVLLGQFGLSIGQLRVAAAWKEVLAISLFVAAAVRLATGRVPQLVIRAPDLLAGAIVALALIHALASLAGLGPAYEPLDLAYGVRDLIFGFTLYAVGRTTPALADDRAVLGRLFAVGVVTSAVAVVEWLVVTPQDLVLLGAASYFNDFLGASAMTRSNEFGLPGNYWTTVGGRLVQRAGSVHMSGQGFAVTFLILVPAATVWLTLARRWRAPLYVAAYGLVWAGLLLTITRATIAACLLQVIFLLMLWRRPAALFALGAAGTAVAAALLVAVPGLATFVWETALWQTASSGSHSNDYYNGLASMVSHPLGAGLGTTDLTATRLGRTPIMGDNLLLKYGVELGIVALVLIAAWLGSVVWTGLRTAGVRMARTRQGFCAFAAACALGVTINGITAVVFTSPMLLYLFFWSAGTAVAIATVPEGANG